MHRRSILGWTVAALAGTRGFAADLRGFERAKLSLAQAVETAERNVGGRAVAVGFEDREERPGRWEVKVLTADRLVEVKLDAESGLVLSAEPERLERLLRRLTHGEVQGAQTSLLQAVGVAEKQLGGRAIEAEARREDGRVEYDIEVVVGGKKREVRVSGVDGRVIAASD
jgi:uncharacterized membrane protein YkoI